MAKKSTQDPYVTRAQLASLLRYKPELDALSTLLKQAQDRRDAAIAGARSTARGTVALIDQTRPQLEQVYDVPGLQAAAAAPQLPGGQIDFQSAQAFEQQGAAHRLQNAAARAVGDLVAQRTAAAAAEPYMVQQARAQYDQDAGQIANRLQQISGEKGAFEASTLLDLIDKGNERRNSNAQKQADRDARAREGAANRRTRRIVAGVDANGRPLPGRKKNGKSSFTPQARRTTARTIRNAVDGLGSLQLPKSGDSAVEAAKTILLTGLKSKDGKTTLLAPQTKDRFLAQAAAERYVYGGVSAATNKRLRKQYGITAKPRPKGVQGLLSGPINQAVGSLTDALGG